MLTNAISDSVVIFCCWLHSRQLHEVSRKNALVPTAQSGRSIILPRYYFSPAIILTRLSYTKMVKNVAFGSLFASKNSPKCFCGRSPLGELPRLIVAWGVETPISFPTSPRRFPRPVPRLLAIRHAAPVLVIKSRRLYWWQWRIWCTLVW